MGNIDIYQNIDRLCCIVNIDNTSYKAYLSYKLGCINVLSIEHVGELEITAKNIECHVISTNEVFIIDDIIEIESNIGFKSVKFKNLIKIDYCFEQKDFSDIKFKKINFTFDKINEFLAGLSILKSKKNKNSFTITQKNCKGRKNNLQLSLPNNFVLSFCQKQTQDKAGKPTSSIEINLNKWIELESENEITLSEFMLYIDKLILFFSVGLKQRVIIDKMWSSSNFNSSSTQLILYPSQIKPIQEKSIDSRFDMLYCWGNFKNLEQILSNFILNSDNEKFEIFLQLYLRATDYNMDYIPQLTFLTLTQGLESYLNFKKVKSKKNTTAKLDKIVNEINNKYNDKRIESALNNLKQTSFFTKIQLACKQVKIIKILDFSKDNSDINENVLKLITDIKDFRVYFTHYGKLNKKHFNTSIKDVEFALKILSEIFILDLIGINTKDIKTIIANNYSFLDYQDFYFKTYSTRL